jgi:hypothetical protein
MTVRNVKWFHSTVFRVVTCVVLWDTDVTEESAASIFMVEIEVFALQACDAITFVFVYWRCRIKCLSHPEGSGNSRGMLGPIRCPETSIRSYQVRSITFRSERISHTHIGVSLKYRLVEAVWNMTMEAENVSETPTFTCMSTRRRDQNDQKQRLAAT